MPWNAVKILEVLNTRTFFSMCLIKIMNFEQSYTSNENTGPIDEIDMSLFLYSYLCSVRISIFIFIEIISWKTELVIVIFITAVVNKVYFWSNEVSIQSLKSTDNQIFILWLYTTTHSLQNDSEHTLFLKEVYEFNFLSLTCWVHLS